MNVPQLIQIIQHFGIHIGGIYRDDIEVTQYLFNVQYLKQTLDIIFEFDSFKQYVGIIFYNNIKTQEKKYLEIVIALNDIPYLKYIENDKSPIIPIYSDSNIKLGGGEYLMNLTHKLLHFIGFTNCRLDDDSHLKLGYQFRAKLWLYLLIKNGKSWYHKFGYLPSTVSVAEYNLLIEDMRKLKLSTIQEHIKRVRECPKLEFYYPNLVASANNLYNLLISYPSIETVYDFIMSQDINISSQFLNELTQSVYGRSYDLAIVSEEEEERDDEVVECSISTILKRTSDEPFNETSNQPLIETSNQPLVETSNQPLIETLNQPLIETLNQPLNDSSKEPLNDSSKEPLNETLNQPLNDSSKEPSSYPNSIPTQSIHVPIIITFDWYNTYTKLMVANVMQTNNNISEHFYQLPIETHPDLPVEDEEDFEGAPEMASESILVKIGVTNEIRSLEPNLPLNEALQI